MKKVSHGFIVIDVRTGEILSGNFRSRSKARGRLREIAEQRGARFDSTGRTSDPVARHLGVHHIELYPGEVYDPSTYRP